MELNDLKNESLLCIGELTRDQDILTFLPLLEFQLQRKMILKAQNPQVWRQSDRLIVYLYFLHLYEPLAAHMPHASILNLF